MKDYVNFILGGCSLRTFVKFCLGLMLIIVSAKIPFCEKDALFFVSISFYLAVDGINYFRQTYYDFLDSKEAK